MRPILSTFLVANALAITATAASAAPQAPARGQQFAANSADRYAVKAEFTGAQTEVGYSSSTRRIADCLASYPGYNPKTDRIWSRSGPKQRCKL